MEQLTKKEYWFSFVKKSDSCWLWLGGKTRGYGTFYSGKVIRAHRWAYINYVGPIGDKFVCHSCDVRGCVNPKHLFLGTNRENMIDASKKGRLKGIPRPTIKKEVCLRGHQMKEPNLYFYRDVRYCLACRNIRNDFHNAKAAIEARRKK